jgi:hypothetical protein
VNYIVLFDKVLWNFRSYKLSFLKICCTRDGETGTEYKDVQQDAKIQYREGQSENKFTRHVIQGFFLLQSLIWKVIVLSSDCFFTLTILWDKPSFHCRFHIIIITEALEKTVIGSYQIHLIPVSKHVSIARVATLIVVPCCIMPMSETPLWSQNTIATTPHSLELF